MVTVSSPSQSAEAGQPLTPEQVTTFYREGYILVRGLVPQSSIDAVLEAARPHYETDQADKENKGWQAKIFDLKDPSKDRAWHRLFFEPSVIDAVEQIFEAPARIFFGMLAVVPPHGGKGLPWHQDNMYTTVLGRALNTFVAISEITPEKANLWVVPRSHTRGVLESGDSKDYGGSHREAVVDETQALQLPTLQPGDVCIFDRNTLHRSLTNQTDSPRYAYAAQYQEAKARMAETGEPNGAPLARDLI
ncbi:MAG: phytanoyl-CoA dioxygenase family protein [Opitutales bacterium]